MWHRDALLEAGDALNEGGQRDTVERVDRRIDEPGTHSRKCDSRRENPLPWEAIGRSDCPLPPLRLGLDTRAHLVQRR